MLRRLFMSRTVLGVLGTLLAPLGWIQPTQPRFQPSSEPVKPLPPVRLILEPAAEVSKPERKLTTMFGRDFKKSFILGYRFPQYDLGPLYASVTLVGIPPYDMPRETMGPTCTFDWPLRTEQHRQACLTSISSLVYIYALNEAELQGLWQLSELVRNANIIGNPEQDAPFLAALNALRD